MLLFAAFIPSVVLTNDGNKFVMSRGKETSLFTFKKAFNLRLFAKRSAVGALEQTPRKRYGLF